MASTAVRSGATAAEEMPTKEEMPNHGGDKDEIPEWKKAVAKSKYRKKKKKAPTKSIDDMNPEELLKEGCNILREVDNAPIFNNNPPRDFPTFERRGTFLAIQYKQSIFLVCGD